MSEIIEFPKNKEMFLKNAVEAYASSQLSQAIQHLEKALAIEPDLAWYPLYVTLLLEAYEIDRAEHFFNQHFPNIAEQPVNVALDILYIRLLIELWELEKATETIEHRLNAYQHDMNALEQLQLLQQQIEQYEQDYQHDEAQLLEEILKKVEKVEKVEKVDSLPFYQQRELLPLLNHLDRTCYVECFERLLLSNLHPILKTYLLELGLDKGMTPCVDMQWFDEKRSVNMATLQPVMSHELYIICLATIDKTVNDNTLKDMLTQNTLLYFSILYPYPEILFNDSAKFIQTLLKRNAQEATTYQKEWFDKIEEIINQMTD